ncbi:response regulator [Niabella sp. CC-SYL272]|uniref:hybrid sensor histidine kinase/response regulator transcription factor n=1 Tax=Niabella agricola TaxID=2891571 RepID=UPI001F41CE8D|nr:hybrid sensor histidine kinase/response regulator transcription factor [Niabella agricola]MCF3110019.1 response regulator [Niabella agricola]
MKGKGFWILFYCLQIYHFSPGQPLKSIAENRYFRTISVDQGLSQSTVFVVQQDQQGFIWVGTQDGLNRYDGKAFTVFRPSKKDGSSLFSSYIRSLYTDHRGMLWVGGNKGVSCYNYKKERFDNYPLPVKPGEWFVSGITADQNNRLWIAANTGELYYLDAAGNRFVPFPYKVSGTPIHTIQQLLFIGSHLFLATDKGVYDLDPGTQTARQRQPAQVNARINALLPQGQLLWMGSENSGLFCLDLKNDQVTNYVHQSQTANSLIDDDIRSLAWDEMGHLWIGTFRGLSILDTRTASFSNFDHQSNRHLTLSQNSVRCIFKDRQNGMWLGTFFGGLNYYHKDDIRFNILSQTTGSVLLNDQVVNVIKEDPAQHIWIGTNDKGINIWNRKTNQLSYLSHTEANANSISSNNIKAIAFDPDGNALIGTFNAGLNIVNKKTGAVKKYMHDPSDPFSVNSDMVHALLRDQQNRIWVGTRVGLSRFDQVQQRFIRFDKDPSGKQLSSEGITSLLQDRKGRIWIGTINGMNALSPDLSRLNVFAGTTLSNELVNCIAEDQQGRIWVGTRDGLNFFDERQQRFIAYTGADHTIEGAIFGVQSDDQGGVWVSTSKGLIKLYDAFNKLQVFNNQTGMGNMQLSLPAFCKASDGLVLFGGLNGLIYFYPQSIQLKPFDLRVTFTGLDIFNTHVTPGSSYKVLNHSISETNSLRLSHEYKQFTVYFSTFNYIAPGSIQYHYRLKGFDNNWQVCDNIPKAMYTNLKPGDYTLEVQATGPVGEKSPVRTLQIRVLPPWWRSNGFYLLLAAVLGVIAYIAYRVINERIKAKTALKKERNDREKAEYLNQMKMDFFTNISHEFKTPLTLIIAPLEEMMAKPVPEKKLRKYHERMLGNAKRLYQLVDQLMDFRKTENGLKKLELTQGDIVSFMREIYSSFLELSRQKNIKYYFKANRSEFSCYFDRDAVEKICNNLLSNAFKYTHPEDTVELSFEHRNEQMLITVSDTGVGIASADHERVFQRFYQVNHSDANWGSGVGLAFAKSLVELHQGTISIESVPDKGTIFTVQLPANRDAYQAEAFNTENHYTLLLDNLTTAVQDDKEAAIPVAAVAHEQQLLIVDDNEQIVDYLAGYFGNHFTVVTAYNGQEALQRVEAQAPDMIICDVMMPETDGIQFCKKIKQNIITCHIPVILLTAKSEPTNQVKGLEAGADDYVTKPFSLPVLDAKVQNILRSRRRLKEYYSSATEIVPENIALNTLDEDFLRKAITIVEESLSDPEFSVLKFSRSIGMSRSSLYLKLKAITGESTTDFIKRIKFKKAAALLESKEYSVTEVAYMSGFSSLSYFSTSFKQYYGCLPTEYISKKQTES